MRPDLAKKIAEFNTDFQRFSGEKPRNFVCPILLEDQPAEIIKGHIISQSLKDCCRKWVPQRKDIDGAFSSAEADFQTFFPAMTDNVDQLFAHKKTNKQVRPQLELKGRQLKHRIIPKRNSKDGVAEVEIRVEIPKDLAEHEEEIQVEVVVDKDVRGAAFMASLQAAHLSMFELFGYSYAAGAHALQLRTVLSEFALESRSMKSEARREKASTLMLMYLYMHAPIGGSLAKLLEGTVDDRKFLCIFDEDERDYAWGVIVRFGADRIAVFIPSNPATTGTYNRYLQGEFSTLRARLAEFQITERRLSSIDLAPNTFEMPLYNEWQ